MSSGRDWVRTWTVTSSRDRVDLDEVAAEVEVGLRGGGEADLDLLEAHLHEGLEHALLALVVHRVDEGLVAVAKVDAAPDGGVGDDPPRPLAVRKVDGREGPVLLDGHSGRGPAWPARLPAREPRGPDSIRLIVSFLQKRKSPPSFPGAGFVTVRSAQHYVPTDPLRVPVRARSASSAFMARILGPAAPSRQPPPPPIGDHRQGPPKLTGSLRARAQRTPRALCPLHDPLGARAASIMGVSSCGMLPDSEGDHGGVKTMRDLQLPASLRNALREARERLAGEFRLNRLVLFGSVTQGRKMKNLMPTFLSCSPHDQHTMSAIGLRA